ncbi:maltodextrin phosphorylase [Alteromonas australica]|jgi:starch phosphorylase|uniref:Alpha-1,4 glucan phosphorylase n=2 Tax=Alteromonas australica TaxID=589873 RepID=A0A075P5K1_9ALTE|nr:MULTISPECIES: glycogen/starch/alpha-glucan phosphorylase [Alteromonas]MAB92561.1 glycogen/starch/alpha-glucan phosphorylase [Alteromonas sp.]AIF98587.1 maltodextrin phosphorylase [Alteromonas australica]AJP43598.1 maltodextrin phosphorylase [Alteromonas australica]QPL48594.1 glycogen/starch/alpha-glucan phosphorylase [Alteromonas sp. B31-7]HAI73575.1 glycogen/starch/alpha-glucan phosphorylase [Alteromonas australica]|tara:strand:- start:1397 stop:3874 length:2478 start_codon:yes stop_codon:yes gene_type:complete
MNAKANNTQSPAKIDKSDFKAAVVKHLHCTLGTDENKANNHAWWKATCAAMQEHVLEGLRKTQKTHYLNDTRAVHYFSAEFLMGRLLSNNLQNFGLFEVASGALKELGVELTDIMEQEPDMALGNGGLGRLAACFIDSLATMELPAIGYGIHYEHGLFRQEIKSGAQIERPDSWRDYGNPWEICRPESIQEVSLFGYVETKYGENGRVLKEWHPGSIVKGVPWDIPVVGYEGKTVNVLRLWQSEASDYFNWDVFNAGGYVDAQRENVQAETISKVLYPNDETEAGKELRLIQQYFFCSCSLKDIIRRYKRAHGDDWSRFADQVVIQLNDTHPAIAIPELMRILVDRAELDWDQAWGICTQVFAYTNHTLLPEALEKWPARMIEKILPRHLEIIYEINHRFMAEVDKKWPGDNAMKAKLSIIEEGHEKMVRMGHLSVIGSFAVNGVAEMHSRLVKSSLFPEFDELYPGKLTNVTNGITPRRWLKACNPSLSKLIDKKIGVDWPKDLYKLEGLAKFASNKTFQKQFMKVKLENKELLAEEIRQSLDLEVDVNAIFDVQIKRLHEYKRQHLNLLHIMALYRRILENPDYDMHPRVFIFGAKAAPGYKLAKDIIYAINKVADKINNDPRVNNKIKVVFLPNYRVSLAEKMIPASDVSEQISTAGKEASGTGNMKLALNGAVTIGTLDGANVEIAEEVGDDNIFIFGLTVEEVNELKAKGYNPLDYYYKDPEIKAVLDWLETDYFTPGKPGALVSIKQSLLDHGDPYMVLADYRSYSDAQIAVDEAYRDKERWAEMAIINTAKMGKFTSDRSIKDYVDRIWKLSPCKIEN